MSEKPVASIKTLARYEPDIVYIGTGEYVAECVRADDGDYYLAADVDAAIEALRAEVERLREIVRPKREEECLTLDHWRMRAYALEANWSRCSRACAVEQTKREEAEASADKLRAEVATWEGLHASEVQARQRWQARAERLAEALRDAADDLERGIDARIVVAQARAALRDQGEG